MNPLDPAALAELTDAADLAFHYQRDHDNASAAYTEASRERTDAIHAERTRFHAHLSGEPTGEAASAARCAASMVAVHEARVLCERTCDNARTYERRYLALVAKLGASS